jgi:hypothetical protein
MPNSSESLGNRTFVCPHCERPTTGEIRGLAIWDGSNGEYAEYAPPTEWAFVQCNTCKHPIIHWREDYGEGFESDEAVVLYPAGRQLSLAVPTDLRAAWQEAQACFQAKAYTATAVMVRRTLEGTCKEQGVDERTLALALRKLQAEGTIDGMLAEWANVLRAVGNEGAHFTGKDLSREEAADALSFAEALLDHIYVLKRRFDEFSARRAASRG